MQVDRFITSQAIMLALAGLPGIYFHSLFGSRNDRSGVQRSGIPRRINRQKLDRVMLEQELASPATLRARVFSRYRDLLERRRGCAAFHPQGRQEILGLDDRLFTLVRTSPDRSQRVLCAHNVSKQSVDLHVPESLVSGRLSTLLQPPGSNSCNRGGRLRLGPCQFLWLQENRGL
jgi:sucrose phosphorylase